MKEDKEDKEERDVLRKISILPTGKDGKR